LRHAQQEKIPIVEAKCHRPERIKPTTTETKGKGKKRKEGEKSQNKTKEKQKKRREMVQQKGLEKCKEK
jgi:hypothetical protein